MYNNRPPPPVAGPSGSPMPPFPPSFSPNGPPSGFPPFPPPGGFVRPPFAPTLPIPGSQPLPGISQPLRPPPQGANGIPSRPAHPGLGLPPLPTGMPAPPHLSSAPKSTPSFVKEVKTTSVFVGSIAAGITDDVLRSLLNACGPLHELKRVVGASGKPQAFAFALFESPEVVMRCIRCLNGIELPDMSPEGRGMNPPKALVVKVDEKTKEFLDEFEKTLGRSDDEEAADAMSRRAIAHFVNRLTDPNAAVPPDIDLTPQQAAAFQVVVPAHLQDLKEGDLPEAQRVAVLDQIAVFREAAMRQDQEKRRQDDERDRNRSSQQPYQPALADYGYGTRALPKSTQAPARKPSRSQDPGSAQSDPQGYAAPVAFVKAKAVETKVDSDRTDEENEQLRLQQRERDRDAALRDRERRVEGRERGRIEALNRELAYRKQQKDLEERAGKQMLERLHLWDDDEKIDRGREWFYSDRPRWRAARQQRRTVEYQEDVRDRQAEEDELRMLELESEEFLRRQMAELSELEEEQRRKGLLSEDAAPVRLALDAIEAKPKEEKIEIPRPQPALALDAEDDDEDTLRKKRRTLVKLDDGGSALDEGVLKAERAAQRNAQLLGVRRALPKERRRLWEQRVDWRAITPELLDQKILSFVQSQTKRYLGDVDADVVDFVIEHIKDRKGPDELMDGLEPLLAEEAVAFTSDMWRQVVFESLAFKEGLETGDVLVA